MAKKINSRVVYQIYPLSFSDSDGSGTGDIKGIINKLDYLKKLGVTDIWLSPIYKTAFKDNGYDIINYYNIDKTFGNMDDFGHLINEARSRGIKIMMDIVLNHTSNKHDWFLKSINRVGKYKDYYVWRNKINNLKSDFSDNAWTFNDKRKQWYFSNFTNEQPDLNWENRDIIDEFSSIINFWIDKGVKGFRFDVADMIGKKIDQEEIINIENAYKILRNIGKKSWLNHENILTVGECWSTSIEDAINYVNVENGVFSTIFNGGYLFTGFGENRFIKRPFKINDFNKLKSYFEIKRKAYDGKVTNALFVENHDFPRSISRWFTTNNYQDLSKIIATSFYGYPGIPFIFEGQECGFPNPLFDSIDGFNDPETKKFINNYQGENALSNSSFGSRDNSRMPIKWNDDYDSKKTWLSNASYRTNVPPVKELLSINDSSIYYYKNIFQLRKKYSDLFSFGKVKNIKIAGSKTWIYEIYNDDMTIIFAANWSSEKYQYDFSNYKKILGSAGNNNLGPFETFIGFKKVNHL